jgi:hypothetical protein
VEKPPCQILPSTCASAVPPSHAPSLCAADFGYSPPSPSPVARWSAPSHVRHYGDLGMQAQRAGRWQRLRPQRVQGGVPESSALIRSASTTCLPSQTFTSIDPGSIIAKVRPRNIPSSSGVSGQQAAARIRCRQLTRCWWRPAPIASPGAPHALVVAGGRVPDPRSRHAARMT